MCRWLKGYNLHFIKYSTLNEITQGEKKKVDVFTVSLISWPLASIFINLVQVCEQNLVRDVLVADFCSGKREGGLTCPQEEHGESHALLGPHGLFRRGGTWTGNSFSAGCSATLHTNYPLWADIHLGKHCVFCVIQPVDRDIYNQEHAQKYLWYSFGPHWADIRALIFFMNIYFFNHVYLSYKSTFNNFITFYLPPDPYLKTFCKYPNQFRLFQKTKGESEFKNIFLKTEPICGSVLTELLKFIRIIFGENCLFWCLRVLFHWNLLASKWLLSNYLRLTK